MSSSIFSQKLELTWGELVKSNNHRFLGGNEQYFFAIERLASDMNFKVYDYDANLVSSKTIKKTLEGDRIYVSKVIRFNEKDFCLGPNPIGVVVDEVEAVNIDRLIDFKFAQFISKNKF